jgi:DNA replication initiation complex subunit (GINS family)
MGEEQGGHQEKKVNISYQVLFELARREKTRDELQKLEPTFFDDIVEYLNEKKQLLKEQKQKLDTYSVDEQDKTERQLDNIYRLIKDLYERREKKIVMMALSQSRTRGAITNTTTLLNEEAEFYEELVKLFDGFRAKILSSIIQGRKLEMTREEPTPEETEKKQDKMKMVRFLHAVPKFLGKELEVYGPFEEEDVASLPEEIAELLITKGRAEELSGG